MMVTKSATLLMAACALAATPAAAVTRLIASVGSVSPYLDDSESLNSEFAPVPTDAIAQASLSRSYFVGSPFANETVAQSGAASAGFGWLRASATVTHKFQGGATQTSHNTQSSAYFEDMITINNGVAGSAGIATFAIRINGGLRESYGTFTYGSVETAAALQVRGGDFADYPGLSALNWSWVSETGVPGVLDVAEIYYLRLRYTSGVARSISASLLCSAYSGGSLGAIGLGEAQSNCDLGHTVTWQGLQSSVDAFGAPIAITISSESGTDYARAISAPRIPGAVPEPSSWALLIAGFGLVGGTLRRASRGQAQPVPA